MRRSGFRNSAAISRLKALKTVVETFVRSNSASLEKTNSGATWTDIRGAWAIASNAASTSTAGSSYPISVLTFVDEDVTISVGGVGPGMGTAFWVTDSNNWWGAYVDGVQTCSTCETPGNPATYTYNYVSGGNCATYSTVPGNCATYSTVNGNCSTYSTVPGNCTTYSMINVNCSTYSFVAGNCSTYSTTPGNCSTWSMINVNCSTYSTTPGNCATWSTVPGNCSTWSTSCSYPCNATTPSCSYPCNATTPSCSYPCNANNASNCSSYNSINCSTWSRVPAFNFFAGYGCPGVGNGAPGSSCGLTFAQAQACGGCKNLGSTWTPATFPCNANNTQNCAGYNASNCSTWSTSCSYPCSTWSTSCSYPCSTWSTSCSYPCNAVNPASYPCNATNPTNYPCNAFNKAYPCNATNPASYPCNATNPNAQPCNAYNKAYPCNATNATNYPCNATNATNYPCNATNPASYPCNATNPVTYATVISSYNAATYYTCNCVTDNKIKIVKMIAGTLTTVATLSFASAIASFKAILSGNTITIQAFTGSNWTTQIGSDQSTVVSGYTKTKKHGILKGVVTYSPSETSTIDEFRVG